MRTIKQIFIHCTATPPNTSIQSIENYWKNVRGWNSPGYHFLIERDGIIRNLQAIEKISNGAKGYNQNSIHISYIGGIDENYKPIDNRSAQQIESMIKLLKDLCAQFPDAIILGHNEISSKACPSFDVQNWIKKALK